MEQTLLTDTEKTLLANALRAAADLYQQDAIEARSGTSDMQMNTSRGAVERLSEQFLEQHRMALDLANRIECADRVAVEHDQ